MLVPMNNIGMDRAQNPVVGVILDTAKIPMIPTPRPKMGRNL